MVRFTEYLLSGNRFSVICMDYAERAADIHEQTALSEKEAMVAVLRAQGYTFREIADELDASPQAIHAHSRRAKEKAEQAEQTVAELEAIGFIE